MESDDLLLLFLQERIASYPEQTPAEKYLLFQYFTKVKLLQSGATVQEDDWDYISLGVLIKQMLRREVED